MKTRLLSEMKEHETGRIQGYTDLAIESKLISMGLLPNCYIKVKRRNAMGNTFIILINDRLRMALRKKEAECIRII